MLLVRADDDVVLAGGGFLDGVNGVVDEILADVEFVVALARVFFADEIRDVGSGVGHFDEFVGEGAGAAGGLGGWGFVNMVGAVVGGREGHGRTFDDYACHCDDV